jgi:hypothetical protein
MQPDLMKSASAWFAFNQAVARGAVRAYRVIHDTSSQRFVLRLCFFGPVTMRRGERLVNDTLIFRPASNDGEIGLLCPAVNKLQLQGIQNITFLRHQHNAARGLVQPVDRLQPLLLFSCFVDEVAQIECLVEVNVRSVDQEPARFHDGHPPGFFEQDAKLRFCTFGR